MVRVLAGALIVLAGSNVIGVDQPIYSDPRRVFQVARTPDPLLYPWRLVRDPTAIDTYGFTARQCTSYIAWFLNTHGIPFGRNVLGPKGVAQFNDADEWDRAAQRIGYAVSTSPAIGSIAQWHRGESSLDSDWTAGPHGHVAIVVRVNSDGTVNTIGYNGTTRQFEAETGIVAPRYILLRPASPTGTPRPEPIAVTTRPNEPVSSALEDA
jgi:surface antigen